MKFLRSIAVAITLVACPMVTLGADEDSADVKPLSYWVERLASDDAVTRKAAADALLANYDGIFEPPLFDDGDESAAQDRFRTELKPHFAALCKLLDCKHDGSREIAAYLMAVIGQDAKDAEPALLRLIRSKTTTGGVKMAAITALLHVVPPNRAVGPTLLAAFNEDTGGAVTNQLDIGKADAPRDGDEYEEARAGISATGLALMLAQSGRSATEVPTLVKLTTDKYRLGIRLTNIYTLAEIEGDSKAAIPDLRKLLSDNDRRIRSAAGWAVLRIEGSLEELPAVLKAMRLDDKEAAEFQVSVSKFFKEKNGGLKWLRDEADQMMPQLLRQATSSNPFYQRQAIRLLGEIGQKAKEAVPALVAATRSDDNVTRDAAITALKQIDPSAVPPDDRSKFPK